MLDTAEGKKGFKRNGRHNGAKTSENILAGERKVTFFFFFMRAWVDAAHAASPLRHLHAGEGSNLKGMGNFIRFSESIYFTHPHPLHVSSLYISSIKDRQHITAAMETSCLIAFAAALRFSSDWRNTRKMTRMARSHDGLWFKPCACNAIFSERDAKAEGG